MQEHGLKISELVTLFNLEVLNRGSDYDTALLTITDVNRPARMISERLAFEQEPETPGAIPAEAA